VDAYTVDGDCDDADAATSPAETEVCSDGIDNDCSGDAPECELSGTVYDSDAAATLSGASSGGRAGDTLSAGDFDGDGLQDLFVGAPDDNSETGSAYIVYGPLSSASLATADVTWSGASMGDRAGSSAVAVHNWSIYNAGIVLGIEGSSGLGNAMMLAAPLTSGTATGGWNMTGDAFGSDVGSSVVAYDASLDGLDQSFVVGAPSADTEAEDAGAVYMLPLTAWYSTGGGIITKLADATWLGESEGDEAGAAMASNGDVDGDGINDLLIGAPAAAGGASSAGSAYLVSGPTSGVHSLADADAIWSGSTDDSAAGSSLRLADATGSGVADAIVSAPAGASSGLSGTVYVLSTTSTGTIGSLAAATIVGDTDDLMGFAVSAIDVDVDGVADLFIGSPGDANAGADAGAAYLFLGPLTGTLGAGEADLQVLGSPGEELGATVLLADLLGTGSNQLVVAAPASTAGDVHIFDYLGQ